MSHDPGTEPHGALVLGQLQASAAELRKLAGLPPAPSVVHPEAARRAGRQLALHPVLTRKSSNGHDVVPEVLVEAAELLEPLGVHLEVVRTREGFAALRSTSHAAPDGLPRCPLCKGLLEAIPEVTGSGGATLVEVACTDRGDEACLYSLVWRRRRLRPAPSASPRFPDSVTLGQPPVDDPPGPGPQPAADGPEPPPSGPSVSAQEEEEEAGGDDSQLREAESSLEDPAPGPRDTVAPPHPDGHFAAEGTAEGLASPEGEPVRPVGEAPRPQAGTGTGGGGDGTAGGGEPFDPADRSEDPHEHEGGVALATRVEPALDVESAGTLVTEEPAELVGRNRPGLRTRRGAPWLWRRGWMVALCVLAGAVGGWFAGARHATSYTAQATLLVHSGASRSGPGSANEALALAITYSAVVPSDSQLLSSVAHRLGTSESDVASRVNSSVDNGTSLMFVTYTASTPQQAEHGASVLAQAVSGAQAVNQTIPRGSVSVVHLPTTATVANTMKKYGAPLGALLGLALGFIIVLAAERADPRVDDEEGLSQAAHCPVTAVPSDVSDIELARSIARRGQPGDAITLVPLTGNEQPASVVLAERLAGAWPTPTIGHVVVGPPFDSGRTDIARGSGPTVLVVGSGAAQRLVSSAVERLGLLGRTPIWAVLTMRVRRMSSDGRAD